MSLDGVKAGTCGKGSRFDRHRRHTSEYCPLRRFIVAADTGTRDVASLIKGILKGSLYTRTRFALHNPHLAGKGGLPPARLRISVRRQADPPLGESDPVYIAGGGLSSRSRRTVHDSSMHTTGFECLYCCGTRRGRRYRRHAVFPEDALDQLEARFTACNHEPSCGWFKRLEDATRDGSVGDIPAIGPNSGGSGHDPVAHSARSYHRPLSRRRPGDDVDGVPARTKETQYVGPQRRCQRQRCVNPWQVSTRFDRTDQLAAHPSPVSQLRLSHPGGISHPAQLCHARNLADALDL